MNFNEQQTKAIEEMRNCVVVAGAGSGKTAVLSERFLNLVIKHGATVDSILTVTFTEKAAAEMKDRIYKKLLEKSKDNEECKKAVEDFSKARISTFDSLCGKIVRSSSWSVGLPPDYIYDEERENRLCENVARDILLEKCCVPVIQELMSKDGFFKIWQSFFTKMAKNFYLSEQIDYNELLKKREDYVKKELIKVKDEMLDIIENINEKFDILINITNKFKEGGDAYEIINAIDRTKIREQEDIFEIYSRLHKKYGPKSNDEYNKYKELIDLYKEKYNSKYIHLLNFMKNSEYNKEFYEIVNEFQARIIAAKQKEGIANFTDISKAAVYILKTNLELRKYYKSTTSYIMVDEFQDTNEDQKNLLYFIAEKSNINQEDYPMVEHLESSKLFFVGDEKQSIYRFRGADVSVFTGLSSEIDNTIKLSTNYRSEEGLIDFFNSIFEGIMTPNKNNSYEVSYTPLSAASKVIDKPIITLSTVKKDQNSDTDKDDDEESSNKNETEFYAIANFIKNSVNKLDIKKNGHIEKAKYNDFTILLKSTTNQELLEIILNANDIPYRCEKLKSFFKESIVNDILLVLKLTIFEKDELSQAAFFRSPFVSATDEEIFDYLKDGIESDSIKNGTEFINRIRKDVDIKKPSEILSDIWNCSGYKYNYEKKKNYKSYSIHFEYLLNFSKDYENKTMSDFIIDLEKKIEEGISIDNISSFDENKSGIQIMTIHKSKGLQFPIVIIANANSKITTNKKDYFYDYKIPTDKDLTGLSFDLPFKNNYSDPNSSNYFYECAKNENNSAELAELKRLLYVACTRAESHIVITSSNDVNSQSFYGMLKETDYFKDNIGEIEIVEQDKVYNRNKDSKESDFEKLKQLYQTCSKIEAKNLELFSDTITPSSQKEEIEVTTSKVNKSLPIDNYLEKKSLQAPFGTLVHALIECAENETMFDDALLLPFEDKANDVLKCANELVKDWLKSNLYLQCKNGKMNFEKSFMFKQGEKFVNATIDLFSELDDKVILVDFKTDKIKNPEEHRNQLSAYKYCLENFTGKKVESFLWYVRYNEAESIN